MERKKKKEGGRKVMYNISSKLASFDKEKWY